eukprot:CAMPEP_0115251476 /NCGR_PEP_ID=MMETSP0270-20121206/43649_1 /TAXON_ID=71861 /ORGANISM="Scrippsiella trochoidea, Strain CCMP3099" /LENGTH=129 /DNA_ID=CAMNT_0002666897 /DNA_START=72 /DNA_END=458 /DNA_ORIENTATION=+
MTPSTAAASEQSHEHNVSTEAVRSVTRVETASDHPVVTDFADEHVVARSDHRDTTHVSGEPAQLSSSADGSTAEQVQVNARAGNNCRDNSAEHGGQLSSSADGSTAEKVQANAQAGNNCGDNFAEHGGG